MKSTLPSKTKRRNERDDGKKGGDKLTIEAAKVPQTEVEKVGEGVAIKTTGVSHFVEEKAEGVFVPPKAPFSSIY